MRKFLVISCLCLALVFAFVPLLMPTVASAEQYVDSTNADFYVNWNYAVTTYSSNIFTWNGSPQFTMRYNSFSSNAMQKPYYAPSYFPEYYDLPVQLYFGGTSGVTSVFNQSVNAGYKFGNTAGTVSFTIDDYRTHYFIVLLSYFGRDENDLSSQLANFESQYTINGNALSTISSYQRTNCDEIWEVVDAQSDTGYWVVQSDTSDENYMFRMQFPTMTGGTVTSNAPYNDPFATQNEFIVMAFELTNGTYTFAGNGASNGYIIGMFDVHYVSEEYQFGYDAGYNAGTTSGYDKGYNDAVTKYESMIDSIKQNSYNDGYYAGLENAEQATFFSLFTSIFDGLVTMITGLLNFEFLGYNMLALFKFIFTVGLVMLIFKVLNGGGNSE